MKTQKQVTKANPTQNGMLITSMVEFENLSESQKRTSSSLFNLIGGKSRKNVFSVEDVFHDPTGFELIEKQFIDSISFLTAHIIPIGMQCN